MDSKNGYFLEVQDNSMSKARICKGDRVAVKSQNWARSGDIVAVTVDDGPAMIRRFILDDNAITLQPENPNYEPLMFTIADSQRVKIFGKVLYFLGRVSSKQTKLPPRILAIVIGDQQITNGSAFLPSKKPSENRRTLHII